MRHASEGVAVVGLGFGDRERERRERRRGGVEAPEAPQRLPGHLAPEVVDGAVEGRAGGSRAVARVPGREREGGVEVERPALLYGGVERIAEAGRGGGVEPRGEVDEAVRVVRHERPLAGADVRSVGDRRVDRRARVGGAVGDAEGRAQAVREGAGGEAHRLGGRMGEDRVRGWLDRRADRPNLSRCPT